MGLLSRVRADSPVLRTAGPDDAYYRGAKPSPDKFSPRKTARAALPAAPDPAHGVVGRNTTSSCRGWSTLPESTFQRRNWAMRTPYRRDIDHSDSPARTVWK